MDRFRCILIAFFCSFSAFAQSYDELIDASFKYLDEKNLPAAEESLKQALKKEPANPRNVLLLSNLGTVQKRLGKREDALLSYTGALSRNPQSKTLLSNRAALYLEMNDLDKAIADYTAILTVDEKDEDALYQRGLLFLAKKNHLAAEADFNKIVEVNPNTLTGRKGIATLCKLRGDYADAEKIYTFLIDKIPEDPDLLLGRGELYLLTGKNSRASSDVNKAISLGNKTGRKDPYAYILRARIKILQYEKKAAQKDIELAVSLGYDKEKAFELLKSCK
jgi:tetratricopeptide (TPR) repeat protein